MKRTRKKSTHYFLDDEEWIFSALWGNDCKIFDSSNKEIANVQIWSKSLPLKWTYAYKAESNEMY